MLKKARIAIYVVVSGVIVVGLVWGALRLISALYFDNSNLKPGKEYVTDYVSPSSPYAVQALYDENNHPVDIVIVKAKSGVTVASLGKSAFSYEVKETTSTMAIVLYDNEGVVSGTYEFDTKNGQWASNQASSVQNDLNGLEYKNINYNFSLTFPKSWGTISEKITSGPKEGKIFKTIKLTAGNDAKRYIEVTLVDAKLAQDPLVVDAPMEFLTQDSDFAFYYSGSADYAGAPGMEDPKYRQIFEETKEIIKTFKLF